MSDLKVTVTELREALKKAVDNDTHQHNRVERLQATITELTAALDKIQHWPKHIDGRDFSTWVVQTARAALKEKAD